MADYPRVGGGAALVRDGALLLVHRMKAPEALHWGLPGGKVDLHEALADAIRREIREELGVEITASELLCVSEQVNPAAGEHWVGIVHRVLAFTGEPENREPEKHAAIGWFPLTALPSPLTAPARAAAAALI